MDKGGQVLVMYPPLGAGGIFSAVNTAGAPVRAIFTPACETCDAVEITAHGDTFRRWRCVNCDREFVTNERAAVTGQTTRLTRHCACGEAILPGARFCVACAREVR